MEREREPFGGRWFGIWNVEGEGEPLFLCPTRDDAEHELERRRALPADHDDVLSKFHHVFPCDIAGAWWNSYDPDPRAKSPLSLDEIIAAVRP